jgi:hypothetical protein
MPHLFQISMPKQFEREQKLYFTNGYVDIHFLFAIKHDLYFTDLMYRGSLEGASYHARRLLVCYVVTFL